MVRKYHQITIVFIVTGDYFMVYKPTYILGWAPSCRATPSSHPLIFHIMKSTHHPAENARHFRKAKHIMKLVGGDWNHGNFE